MIGTNLQVGNPIIFSTDSASIKSLAWINNGKLKVLLVNISNTTVETVLSGIEGNFEYQKIDNTYSFMQAKLQTGTLSLSSSILMNGYTVMILTTADHV
jgi:hypothetical protein